MSSSLVKLLFRSPQGTILPCFFLACDKSITFAFLYVLAFGDELFLFMVDTLLLFRQNYRNHKVNIFFHSGIQAA